MLDEVGPQVIMLASLGAALLVATAVPVARVFVLGPDPVTLRHSPG